MTTAGPSPALPPLEALYTDVEVATASRRSVKWLKGRIAAEGIEHTRLGNRTYFTASQFEAFRARDVVTPTVEPITTGPAKKRGQS